MIAYYKLVSNMFGGEQRQLTAVADLVIDDQGVLLKDRQGYVTRALTKKLEAPKVGSKWASINEPNVIWIYVGVGKYYRYGKDDISHEDFANDPHFQEMPYA